MNYLINKIIEDLKAELSPKDVQYVFFGHSYALAGDQTQGGVIEVIPMSTDIESITTGTIDLSTNTFKVVLIKNEKNDVYKNSNRETAMDYLTRVVDGRQADGSLNTNCIRYILRHNMRNYGTVQRNLSIEYDTNNADYSGASIATITVVQEEHNSQSII